jgi:hypothetical protein
MGAGATWFASQGGVDEDDKGHTVTASDNRRKSAFPRIRISHAFEKALMTNAHLSEDCGPDNMEELRREVLRENEQHPEGMALMQRADLPAREGLHCVEPGMFGRPGN